MIPFTSVSVGFSKQKNIGLLLSNLLFFLRWHRVRLNKLHTRFPIPSLWRHEAMTASCSKSLKFGCLPKMKRAILISKQASHSSPGYDSSWKMQHAKRSEDLLSNSSLGMHVASKRLLELVNLTMRSKTALSKRSSRMLAGMVKSPSSPTLSYVRARVARRGSCASSTMR